MPYNTWRSHTHSEARPSEGTREFADGARIFTASSTVRSHVLSSRIPAFMGPHAMQTHGGGAQRVGDILVAHQEPEVLRRDIGEHVESDFQRGLGIEHEVPDDGVVSAILAIHGDQAQDFVAKARHRGEAFDLLLS